jgi:hypothetical protein
MRRVLRAGSSLLESSLSCLLQGASINQNQSIFNIQQGLGIRGFWFQKKTVLLKTVLHEVYTYVLNDIFFKKQ